MPGPPTLPMADTYAVVQKRGAPAGPGPGTRAPGSTDSPIYSQVAARTPRPIAQTEDAQGPSPLGRGELGPARDVGLRETQGHLFACSPPCQGSGGSEPLHGGQPQTQRSHAPGILTVTA